MTRKDYEMLAGIIRRYMEPASDQGEVMVTATLENIVDDLCVELERDNSAFKRDRFEIACGV